MEMKMEKNKARRREKAKSRTRRFSRRRPLLGRGGVANEELPTWNKRRESQKRS